MKKNLLIAGGILLVAGVAAFLMITLRPEPPREEPPPQTPLVQTTPATVEAGTIRVVSSGTVRPRAEVSLAAQVSGKVVYVHPALVSGGRVQEGETLVRINPADYRNAVEQAQADVAQQEVSVMQTEEEAEIARAEYEQFQERQQRRAAQPYTGVDDDDYAARIIPENASADTNRTTPNSLVFQEPQLEAARAALDRAQAALDDAQLSLARLHPSTVRWLRPQRNRGRGQLRDARPDARPDLRRRRCRSAPATLRRRRRADP
jgi:multidrug efflux pump subunit AcrA (membrane-fusion protein)